MYIFSGSPELMVLLLYYLPHSNDFQTVLTYDAVSTCYQLYSRQVRFTDTLIAFILILGG